MGFNNGHKFSAKDKDVDAWSSDCAASLKVDGGIHLVTMQT